MLKGKIQVLNLRTSRRARRSGRGVYAHDSVYVARDLTVNPWTLRLFSVSSHTQLLPQYTGRHFGTFGYPQVTKYILEVPRLRGEDVQQLRAENGRTFRVVFIYSMALLEL